MTPPLPGAVEDKPFIGFPKAWRCIFKNSPLAEITPHVLRHSFSSIADELGFTEATIASMLGHSRGTVTSKYVHALDPVLVKAADTVASYIRDSKLPKELCVRAAAPGVAKDGELIAMQAQET